MLVRARMEVCSSIGALPLFCLRPSDPPPKPELKGAISFHSFAVEPGPCNMMIISKDQYRNPTNNNP